MISRANKSLLKLVALFFMSTLFLSTLQITLAGYQSDDSSWFSVITLLIAEEESEDNENKDKTKKTDWITPTRFVVNCWGAKWLNSTVGNLRYQSVFREVLSPPPEA